MGYAKETFALQFDPKEVQQVIEVPLELLLDASTRQVETHARDNQRFEIPLYRIASHKVWGATAMILAEFLALLRLAQLQENTSHYTKGASISTNSSPALQ